MPRFQITASYVYKNQKGEWQPDERIYAGEFPSQKVATEFMLKREQARYTHIQKMKVNTTRVKS